MALNECAENELLDALSVGDGTDLIRELARWALQDLIEAEATEAIGDGRASGSEGLSTLLGGHLRWGNSMPADQTEPREARTKRCPDPSRASTIELYGSAEDSQRTLNSRIAHM